MSMAYVYEHWRPDTEKCFYVGKGTGKRAYRMRINRNDHHQRIVNKLTEMGLSVKVVIISNDLSDKEAYELEAKRISFYGIENLVNQTAGGIGVKAPSPEVRKKMAAARAQVLSDPEFRERHRQACIDGQRRTGSAAKAAVKKRGRKQPAEAVARRAELLRGRKRPQISERMSGEGNPFFGKRHPPEVLARIAEKKRGRKHSEATKAKMRASQSARRAKEIMHVEAK